MNARLSGGTRFTIPSPVARTSVANRPRTPNRRASVSVAKATLLLSDRRHRS
jgi:hypothetical protein